jgi:hypothetical protein
MAENQNYYFIVENQDISGFINDYELPNGDLAQLVSGFISNSNIDEQALLRLNNVVKYKISVYPKNGVVIDSGTTQERDDPNYPQEIKTYPLAEGGYYYIQMSSSGGRGANLNRFVGRWEIEYEDDNIKDYIDIYEQNNKKTAKLIGGDDYEYTWERIKKNETETITWKGNYVYLNNTVFFNLLSLNDAKYEAEDYGILMLKNDIEDNDKLKLFSYRIDDEVDDYDAKYSSSIMPVSDYNTQDAKGGDGQLYNEIAGFTRGNIGFYIGKGEKRPPIQNVKGGDTYFQNINLLLNGGPVSKLNDFGGRGGSFVYDYWGRIKYNNELPEDGRLLITYLGPLTSNCYKMTVIPDANIKKVISPENEIVAGTIVTIKVLLYSGYEIDYEESVIICKEKARNTFGQIVIREKTETFEEFKKYIQI